MKKLAKEKNVGNLDEFVQVLLEDKTKTATAITKVEASKVITALMAEKAEDSSYEEPF
jgi:hypothetical protein